MYALLNRKGWPIGISATTVRGALDLMRTVKRAETVVEVATGEVVARRRRQSGEARAAARALATLPDVLPGQLSLISDGEPIHPSPLPHVVSAPPRAR